MCSSRGSKPSKAPPVPIPQIMTNPFLDSIGMGGSGSASRLGRSSLRIPVIQARGPGGGSSSGSAATTANGAAGTTAAAAPFQASTFGATDREINLQKKTPTKKKKPAQGGKHAWSSPFENGGGGK